MGSITTHKPAGMSIKDFLVSRGHFTYSADTGIQCRLLASAYKMPAFYAAVETVNVHSGERRVWAAVFKVLLFKPRPGEGDHNICIKDMDETYGPIFRECPANILDLLTPTDSRYANEWREACRANLAQKADRLKNWQDLVVRVGEVTYTVEARHQRGFVARDEHGKCWRMSRRVLLQAERIPRELAATRPVAGQAELVLPAPPA